MKEKKARVEDACTEPCCGGRGIVAGGGVAMVRARGAVGKRKATTTTRTAAQDRAARAGRPLRQIVANAVMTLGGAEQGARRQGQLGTTLHRRYGDCRDGRARSDQGGALRAAERSLGRGPDPHDRCDGSERRRKNPRVVAICTAAAAWAGMGGMDM